jgi:hypothetical protein
VERFYQSVVERGTKTVFQTQCRFGDDKIRASENVGSELKTLSILYPFTASGDDNDGRLRSLS